MSINQLYNQFAVLMKYRFLLIFSIFVSFFVRSQGIDIIPKPNDIKQLRGDFLLTKKIIIKTNDQNELTNAAEYLSNALMVPTGFKLQIVKGKPTNHAINLILDKHENFGMEGYCLSVMSNRVDIISNTPTGIFYGIQSLLQLFPAEIKSHKKENIQWKIPQVQIKDQPRFSWRGVMLDVSRHFFTVEEIKLLIDQMAEYKFNLLHLHLTDDQGWRIEIKSLPELTNIGAWRVPRSGLWWKRDCPKPNEKASYGGFYTQKQIKDIVNYASKHHIQVMPEIDVPGHSLAAIASYPHLASFVSDKQKVNPGCEFYGVVDNALCAGKESTFTFLDKVLTEVAELFPFEYIHIGGDECFKGFWEKCSDCQKRMEDNNLKDVNELQSYFIKRVEKILKIRGKKLMGWDEILEGGLTPNATVMSWRGMGGGIAAAKAGHNVVMTPFDNAYLDLYQGDPSNEPPTYGKLRLSDVYRFEPVPEAVDTLLILGGQGNLWTESVPTFRHVEYMIWPRCLAMSEVLWSAKQDRDWDSFILRLESRLKRFDYSDVNYARSFYDPIVTLIKENNGMEKIKMSTEIEGLDIYYTFDNTYPDNHAKLYTKDENLLIPVNAYSLGVITYRDGKPIGRILSIKLDDLKIR